MSTETFDRVFWTIVEGPRSTRRRPVIMPGFVQELERRLGECGKNQLALYREAARSRAQWYEDRRESCFKRSTIQAVCQKVNWSITPEEIQEQYPEVTWRPEQH